MDIFEVLTTRRSIRKYSEKKIEDQDLELILKCAMLAPSAKNQQPWQFIVVTSTEKKTELATATPHTHMAKNASAVIVVCGDMTKETAPGFWVQDCSAAIQNILLAARGKNIGSCWCGIHPEKERETKVKNMLELPEQVVPLGMICLGYPENQHFTEADRFKPERIHYEKW